jgi:hypothetical protein
MMSLVRSECPAPVGEVQPMDWGDFLFFADPDGNRWSVQGLPDRG